MGGLQAGAPRPDVDKPIRSQNRPVLPLPRPGDGLRTMPRIPPPLLALATAGLIALMARHVPLARFAFPGQTLLAAVIAALALLLPITASRQFSRADTTVNPVRIDKASALVTSGPFVFTRNPMYLGLLLILTAIALWRGAVGGFLPLPLFAGWITRFQILPEEAVLREKFGDAFADYCARTRRWL